jgi:hypothetical protein
MHSHHLADALQGRLLLKRASAVTDAPPAFLFLLVHRAAAAFQFAAATLGDDYLRAALATDVNLSELVSHFFPLYSSDQRLGTNI